MKKKVFIIVFAIVSVLSLLFLIGSGKEAPEEAARLSVSRRLW